MISIAHPPFSIGGCPTEVEPATQGRGADIIDESTEWLAAFARSTYVNPPGFLLERFANRPILRSSGVVVVEAVIQAVKSYILPLRVEAVMLDLRRVTNYMSDDHLLLPYYFFLRIFHRETLGHVSRCRYP